MWEEFGTNFKRLFVVIVFCFKYYYLIYNLIYNIQ
ncbi:MAG: hypothetical protein US83_C0002G0105 [Candidatus Falkowbacteria bacterium GW2011_GWC2_38_22]|uniref:Uncharacterized protein n=1 Tax=Candidatus Falkowbacteria bacterium GW2011_GWE1_38_31 TaxID=1618638 RepID=A0A0G0JVP0_9BACT|nr:MAG: hypothetical protein US73_C0007G0105 [Candidatus Falkowbacteria bacterium GW2011_GWF2_38_1205]KKQ62016.1 MAG: hypothetical protein US83_C0002G0105 [Candidatus Falkowbacteria bacterium GW2011_GWC2_38_22]KKQ63822.1 MAG: hypothetical protein US84_C0003G0012 [Candidatus Falkowbacteria bacterium GW2011_GWF1_38_22]KKQ66079.1 MAG: hypothetical protein US87_C0003G0012 [Candidatus Falkowbacteria bacterium GW2011_GWE2_38_254]KKQ70682.1 MAG: hypothetical protein US91_C0003G0012 [Candidatus Falkowb